MCRRYRETRGGVPLLDLRHEMDRCANSHARLGVWTCRTRTRLETGLYWKVLAAHTEGPASREKPGMKAHARNLSLGGGNRRILGAFWPSGLVNQYAPGSVRPCLRK